MTNIYVRFLLTSALFCSEMYKKRKTVKNKGINMNKFNSLYNINFN